MIPRIPNVKADNKPIRRQIETEGTTPERDVPYGIVNIEVAIIFLIKLRIDEKREDV